MAKEPILETERLVLRPLIVDDAEAVFEWTSDPRVAKYMSYPRHTDICQTIEWLKSTYDEENEWNWAFILKDENKIIGSIGPNIEMKEYWGIGYNIHYDYWHKGYCTEAMKAIIDFAHNHLSVDKICSEHAVDNPRSGRVMEKCGLKFHHNGECKKLDGSKIFKAKFYTLEF